MNRPIRTLVNVKDLPLRSSGDLVRRWKVWVDNQGVVLLLVRRECDFDEVWICTRVLHDEVLYFLDGSFSIGSYEE